MVGAGDRGGRFRALAVLLGQLVQAHRQPLGAAAVVDEHDRRAMRADQLEQLGIDGGPDRALRGLAAGQVAELGGPGVRLAHVVDRHVDLQIERLANAGVHDPALAAATDQEAADLLERALGRRQPDALQPAAGQVLEALERQREVGAALGARHRVDLVDDHRLGVHQELARLRREHQVERLGCGDEHVGRRAQHRLALPLGGVAGADGDADVAADALERGAQVLLDVVRERLQGGDVDEAAAPGFGGQAVEAPQERGERLSRARGRRYQHVLTAGDRGPRLGLRLGRTLEGAREPITDLWGEGCERI